MRYFWNIMLVVAFLAFVAILSWAIVQEFPKHYAVGLVVLGILIGSIVTTWAINRDHPIRWNTLIQEFFLDEE